MKRIILTKLKNQIQLFLQRQSATVEHKIILKDIYSETDIAAGYFVILTLANVVALSGLITNSLPVIIGAMLISPLMGPILSAGFAFITGDKRIGQGSLKKISISVTLTIVVATIATYLSPIKDITPEIASRIRPNLYDLIIAFLAGSAGAIAICTKKNYLTIIPGVAIATAVIPPLSVVGFGIGVWNLRVAFGGFFLFFTNFVAIVLSTCIVFFIYGFRPSMITEEDVSNLKKRIAYLTVVLLVISIPLIYTVHQSVAEVKLRGNIQKSLRNIFDKKDHSHLDAFNYKTGDDKTITVSATVKTVSYLKENALVVAEKDITNYIGAKVILLVEQVLVHPGGLKEEASIGPSLTRAVAQKPSRKIIWDSRESILPIVRESTTKIDKIIAPSSVSDFAVMFEDKSPGVVITLKIKRDAPLSDHEKLWLARLFSDSLGLPVGLKAETVPYVPVLVFKAGETGITDEMKVALNAIKDVYLRENKIMVKIEASPESSTPYNKRRQLAKQRINMIVHVLTADYNIPPSCIQTMINRRAVKEPTVKITLKLAQGDQ